MASDAKNKFPIRRKLRSVYIAKHTKIFPAMDKNIKRDRNTPAKRIKKKEEKKPDEMKARMKCENCKIICNFQ